MRAGVSGLIKTMADEMASQGIRFNNLIPGRIHTDRVDSLDQAAAKRQNISFEEARARSLTSIPMGRLGTPDEFGAAGAFLLSPASAYITGATLRVDGGMMRSI
jgi:3-oxoacyl-[acyl-carrier protein] reductase